MLMADGGSNYCQQIGEDDEYEEFSSEELYMEIDTLLNMLDESSDELQSNQEDLLQGDLTFDPGSHESSRLRDGSQVLESALPVRGELNCQVPSTCNAEASDSRQENVSALFDMSENSLVVLDGGNPEVSALTSSPVHTSSTSLQDWSSQIPRNETSSPEDITVSQFEKHNGHTSSSVSEAGPIHISEGGENFYTNFAKGETEAWTRHVRGNNDVTYFSHSPLNDCVEVNLRNCGTLGESSMETLGPSENNPSSSAATISFMDPDLSTQNATSTESMICQSSDVLSDFDDHYSAMQYCLGSDVVVFPDPSESYFRRGDYRSQVVDSNEEMMNVIKNEVAEFPSNNISSDGRMDWFVKQGTMDNSVSMMSMTDDYSDASRWKYNSEGDNYVSLINDSYPYHANDYHMDDKASMKLSMETQPHFASKQEMGNMKIERNDELNKSSSVMYHSIGVGRSFNSKIRIGNDIFLQNELKPSFSAISPSIADQNHEFVQREEEEMFSGSGDYYSQDMGYAIDRKSYTDDDHLNFKVLDEHLCYTQPYTLNKQSLDVELDEQGGKVTHTKLSDNSHVEVEPDICIIEDMSHPAPLNRTLVVANSVVASQSYRYSDSKNLVGVGSMRHKAKDEQLILSAALQDLSQPKSEASPPDGTLAVPLLRHQKIALSWMVQKETTSLHCCGGILADDQGLGKTISTIALILKERPPCFQTSQDVKHGDLVTLNLDDDEDMFQAGSHQVIASSSAKSTNISVQSKGRPAAGTLVVCPTSVLRQWAEELRNKVTCKANLAVLVYHGSNRTKDPCELAKYDVVITTYSIVSLEVPKQSLGNEDDDEREKAEDRVGSPWELSSSKKRKHFSTSSKKCSKKRKADSALLESVARPLAKVGWFRVVLDEAQSIKNHRTQVARACWGLRAKRRWCLSGTPIQNAIDDLYSYFRFLRYDPYASYKSFCSSIKVPINRNPSKGYKKLQAVLQTIMLRRTKATLLDGKPIINLPSKEVELKKIDFTDEEREFYLKLEADSKAQFEEYAAAGTVKQNYVNILLMLLRLRQACDHPLLVRPYNSNSLWRSSAEMAKKLPRGKQIFLRNRLEASLAICGICNDAPEDAVVSECGHVFCKQCICEHLSGDDKQCPSTNCKVQLCISSIFSRLTLDCSLSEQSSLDCSGSEVVDPAEQFSEDHFYSSSKIKAALEVLQSLNKPRNETSTNNSVHKDCEGIPSCAENSTSIEPREPVKATIECLNLIIDKSSSDPNRVGGEKAIVFSQWTRMLDLLEAGLKNTCIQYRRLDGTMSVTARDTAVKDFNTLPEVTVVIMSLKAASLGLNMVAACHVLLLDLWWNPTTEDQAIDRAHRIGQTRTVKVLRLTVKETIEDRILDLQRKKREMVSSAFGEDETGGRQTRLTVEDLNYLFMM